ncbi:methylphosphotriester-DNA--protein-cysteine methyltransferase family protein [Enterococcus saccharolyticus]|uniref:bifunctional transcriptional activator/DNA repair enzyme AdaA n=1 Tax=Enterococcus TaxID=1350 RepID=UPI001E4D98DE|nr:Ada metal-binding domain-containing protein [Enterococcus saccharolyticus]MCD5001454.1 methylphosphotriester-DNA--protein-cysteine methyltransferase family protein [Enterococcus saccharolyticus]
MVPTKEQLQAIESCDPQYDNQFYYGVKSTKIFCKPSCKSRMPRIENIEIVEDVRELIKRGYRPCKRCRPTDEKLPDVEWIEQVNNYIDTHYQEKLTLFSIAEDMHSSPYHLHRKFKEIKGKTIHAFLKERRMQEAITLLQTTQLDIATIGQKVGIENSSQFVRDFKKFCGQTPLQYRKEVKDENY